MVPYVHLLVLRAQPANTVLLRQRPRPIACVQHAQVANLRLPPATMAAQRGVLALRATATQSLARQSPTASVYLASRAPHTPATPMIVPVHQFAQFALQAATPCLYPPHRATASAPSARLAASRGHPDSMRALHGPRALLALVRLAQGLPPRIVIVLRARLVARSRKTAFALPQPLAALQEATFRCLPPPVATLYARPASLASLPLQRTRPRALHGPRARSATV